MVAKAETETTTWVDTVKLIAAVSLLVAGIAQFYYFFNTVSYNPKLIIIQWGLNYDLLH